MLTYFIVLCCLPIFGLLTAAFVLARTDPQDGVPGNQLQDADDHFASVHLKSR